MYSIPLYVLSFIFLVHTAIGINPLYHICSNSQDFSSSSSYDMHLNILLNQLRIKVPPTGFGHSSVGGIYDRDAVHGLALCRGDVSNTECKSCLNTTTREIQQRCPNEKRAIIWYDTCLLKYSDINFLGKVDYENKFYLYNVQNVSDVEPFNEKAKEFLSHLSNKAIQNPELYATNKVSLNKAENLYGLVQCTRDLSYIQCKKCLDEAISKLSSCCNGKRGGRVVGGSCNLRYELYPFISS